MKYVLRDMSVEAYKLEYNTDSQEKIIAWVNSLYDSQKTVASKGADGGIILKYEEDGDRVVANTGSYVVLDKNGIMVWDSEWFEANYAPESESLQQTAIRKVVGVLKSELDYVQEHCDWLDGHAHENESFCRPEAMFLKARREKLREAIASLESK